MLGDWRAPFLYEELLLGIGSQFREASESLIHSHRIGKIYKVAFIEFNIEFGQPQVLANEGLGGRL